MLLSIEGILSLVANVLTADIIVNAKSTASLVLGI